MPTAEQRLVQYLATIAGEPPVVVRQPASALPLFLRERYNILSAKFFGRSFLLAVETAQEDDLSPGDYEKHFEALRAKLGKPVVFVLKVLPSYARNRMVHSGIPFIVPGSQIFLPLVMMDLRERQAGPRPRGGRRLTPAAQCVVLYHLQRESLSGLPLQEVAKKVGYSPIMLTQVKAQLEAAGICDAVRHGKTTQLGFLREGRELWEHVLPLLSCPDRNMHWVQWEKPGRPALLAGMSALSRFTMIGEDRLPTYALWHRSFLTHLEEGLFHGCRGREEANVCLEAWTYDPLVLGDEKVVDPLSLYLSLKDSPDERVQQQLERLLEGIRW